MKHERCHPCEMCEYYRKAEVKAIPTWEFTGRTIDVIIPICIRMAHTLAINRCDNYEPLNFLRKSEELQNFIEKTKRGGINENKSNIENG